MVLGKVYRLSIRKDETGHIAFLLEHRNNPSESLIFSSGAVTSVTLKELEAIKSQSTQPFRYQIDGYGCLGVLELSCPDNLHLLFLVLVTGCVSIGKIGENEIFRITDTGFISLRGWPQDGERIQEIRRVLNAGTFYFSYFHSKPGTTSSTGVTNGTRTGSVDKSTSLDITLCAQRSTRTSKTDTRFWWNRTLFLQFNRFGINTDRWLLKMMCGGISISTVYVGSKQAKACLFSRLSSERAGTRFNVRGVDDNGYVANFVETEQVIYLEDSVTSYVMIRGSVPLFWEQPGINVGSHKIKMSRGSEITQPSYDRHVALLKRRYGRQHFITLCGSKEGETNLTKMFTAHHKSSVLTRDVPLTQFDYHHYCARGKTENLKLKLYDQLSKSLSDFRFFAKIGNDVTSEQIGTFRVNCVDCLDRTNCVQSFLGLEMLEQQLSSIGLASGGTAAQSATIMSRFLETYKNMWIQNGDQVSRIYAGTGALEGKNKLKDSTLSVARTIQNNLLDSSKQEAMDILLMGKLMAMAAYAERARCLLPSHYLHLRPGILKSLCDQHLQYTSPKKVKITIGTWNVNGGKHFTSIVYKRSDPLSDWLLDHDKTNKKNTPNIMDMSLHDELDEHKEEPSDIFAIGFEEIVDLNASNIVAASTSNQREWLIELQKTISRDVPYVLVTSVQLVGVCLFVFVRPSHAKNLRDVLVDQVKTGLGGATGNKGGVTIRMRFYHSTLAFVCAHFAAGQHQVSDRNGDYHEITKKTVFPGGRTLLSHDYVFWCGDFNYRIDLDNDYCKDLISKQDWSTLLSADQLSVQRNDGKVFDGFIEAPIQFPPTYKYDSNSDDYDTSEKARVPAWTDRILFGKFFSTTIDEDNELRRGNGYVSQPGNILRYGRAELRTSDHRPVFAVVDIDVLMVDEDKQDEILRKTLTEFGPPDGTVLVTDSNGGTSGLTKEVIEELIDQLKSEKLDVVFHKMTANHVEVILKDGQSAIKAMMMSPLDVTSGETLTIKLKTPNWIDVVLHDIKSYEDTITPLYEHHDLIKEVEEELTYGHLGPQVDPTLLVVGDGLDDDSGIGESASGRASPAIFSIGGGPSAAGSTDTIDKVGKVTPPSRPPPPPSGAAATPKRPPPPPSIPSLPSNVQSDDVAKPKPLRPAPPPPQKPAVQRQVALNPPTITKTCPSTDSEHSFDKGTGSFDSTSAQVDPFEAVGHDSIDSTDSVVSQPEQPDAQLQDPVDLVNNAWNDSDPFEISFDDARTRGPPPAMPPPPRPPPSDAEDDDEEVTIRSSAPPPSMAPPPPPLPDTKAPVTARGAPPPIPTRGGPNAPSVPPRPPQVK